MGGSGFVDLQVNGCRGVDFSSTSLTPEDIRAAAAWLFARGTLAFCPTVITSDIAVYRHVLPLLAREIADQSSGAALMPGIHLEGPFISPEDGAVGAHPREHTQLPSLALFDELYALADGHVSLLTLAPELPGAVELIRRAVGLEVVVSIGHTLAGENEIRAAVDVGASLSTHLGNGVPNLLHRHHNPLWPQIAEPALGAMLITDGHHLPPAVIRAVLAAKSPGKVIATSDSAPAAGLPPGDYAFFGTHARLEAPAPGAVCGRLRNLERDTLAGSAATMLDCMNHLAGLNVLDESDLWRVGLDNPLAVLGLRREDLPAGPVLFQEGRFILSSAS